LKIILNVAAQDLELFASELFEEHHAKIASYDCHRLFVTSGVLI